MNESESLDDWNQWAEKFAYAVHSRDLPWETPTWREGVEEPLSIAAVFDALVAIRNGKSRQQKTHWNCSSDNVFDPANWEVVDRPPERAVRIITRALQAGAHGKKLIKMALELKPSAKAAILVRNIARNLTKPKGGWPNFKELPDGFKFDDMEWIKPSKQEVERELERLYPSIYQSISKKESRAGGGKVPRSSFWDDAGLKDVIDQARGY